MTEVPKTSVAMASMLIEAEAECERLQGVIDDERAMRAKVDEAVLKETERARAAEDESLKERRLRVDLEGRLSSITAQLEAERHAHAQTQAQVTTLIAEIRKPALSKSTPPVWKMEMRDSAGNMRVITATPVKNNG